MQEESIRECKTCRDIKLITEFHRGTGYRGGRHPNCRSCRGTKNPDRTSIHTENKELFHSGKRRCTKCRDLKTLDDFKRTGATTDGYEHSCRDCRNVQLRPWYRERNHCTRLEAIKRYGGKCYCCGDPTYEFLSLDHVSGGGNKERLSNVNTRGSNFPRHLKRSGWPTGIQVSCHNCNCARSWWSQCAHEKRDPIFAEEIKKREEAAKEKALLEIGKQRCRICLEILETSEFSRSARHESGFRGVCKKCETIRTGGERRNAAKTGWTAKDRAATASAFNRRLRLEAMEQYGRECACCGEPWPEFLTLDHVEGGGNEHRRSLGGLNMGGTTTLKALKKQGWPKGYRTLCVNCNSAIGYYNGFCPHQRNVKRTS